MKLTRTLVLALLSSSLFYCQHVSAAELASLTIGPLMPVQGSNNVTTDITLDSSSQLVSVVSLNLSVSNLTLVNDTTGTSVFPQQVLAATGSGNIVKAVRARTDKGYIGLHGQVTRLRWQPISAGLASISVNTSASSVLAYQNSANILGNVHNSSGYVTAPALVTTSRGLSAMQMALLIRTLSWAVFAIGVSSILIGGYGLAKFRNS